MLDGEIVVHADGAEHVIGDGGFACAPRGLPHAFMATAETKLLCIQTPGTGEAFFRHASEPATSGQTDGPVDFTRVQVAAAEHGGVVLLGPPAFATQAARG